MARRGEESWGRRAEEGAGEGRGRGREKRENLGFSSAVSAPLSSSPSSSSLFDYLLLQIKKQIKKTKKRRATVPPPDASLLLSPRGAGSLWRCKLRLRLSEEEDDEEERVDAAPIIVVVVLAVLLLLACDSCLLLAAEDRPKATTERQAQATGTCLEAERGAAEGAKEAPAAAVIERCIVCLFWLLVVFPCFLSC